jgi:sugar diacid utilization regulator
MKLSLPILREELGNYVKQYNISTSKNFLHLLRPLFYTEGNIFDSDTLYISDSKELPADPVFKKGASLICIDKPPENYFNKSLDLLIVDESLNILSLGNTIQGIYDKYDLWSSKLQQGMNEWNPIQYMLEISEPIFHNGIAIMDSEYHIIAETPLSREGYIDEKLDKLGTLPVEQINSFKTNKKYIEIADEKEIFLFPNEILPYRCLCKNIFRNNEFLFRIIVTETTNEFKESDAGLLEYMSDYLEEASNHIRSLHEEENSVLTSFFQNMTEGNSFNAAAFGNELRKLGWNQNDTYRVMHIQPSSQDLYITTMSYFCSKLMKEFHQTYAFIKDNIIVVIMNMSKIPDTKDEFSAKLNYFIREGNFRIGLSNYCAGLSNLREYSLQASIALEVGLAQNPMIWSHNFSDNIFPYILNKITEDLPAEFLYSPIITRLQKYDAENQTEYLKTLQTYIENNRNAVQTAKDLFIHRATMVYRIDRIKEIGKTDLKNRDEMLLLYLSFKLLG